MAAELHADYRLDFTHQDLYEDIYGGLGNVRAFAVVLEGATVVRFVSETAGLYVSIDPGVSIQGVISAVRVVMADA